MSTRRQQEDERLGAEYQAWVRIILDGDKTRIRVVPDEHHPSEVMARVREVLEREQLSMGRHVTLLDWAALAHGVVIVVYGTESPAEPRMDGQRMREVRVALSFPHSLVYSSGIVDTWWVPA